MAIQTRFGRPVAKVISAEDDIYGQTWVKVEYEDGTQREVLLYDLRADNGINEIQQAIQEGLRDGTKNNG